jgi:hypothetical protein
MYFMPMRNKERNKQKFSDPLVCIRGRQFREQYENSFDVKFLS